jgi:PIN domain nuclease of toxin-antitoxin system
VRLLLDTHAFLWWLVDDERLPRAAHDAIAEPGNSIFVSAASIWEIATKHRIGKLAHAGEIVADVDSAILGQGFKELPISVSHGRTAGMLPGPHKDPFDRMLIAQAMTETMVLVSNEQLFDAYGVQRLWA